MDTASKGQNTNYQNQNIKFGYPFWLKSSEENTKVNTIIWLPPQSQHNHGCILSQQPSSKYLSLNESWAV